MFLMSMTLYDTYSECSLCMMNLITVLGWTNIKFPCFMNIIVRETPGKLSGRLPINLKLGPILLGGIDRKFHVKVEFESCLDF